MISGFRVFVVGIIAAMLVSFNSSCLIYLLTMSAQGSVVKSLCVYTAISIKHEGLRMCTYNNNVHCSTWQILPWILGSNPSSGKHLFRLIVFANNSLV